MKSSPLRWLGPSRSGRTPPLYRAGPIAVVIAACLLAAAIAMRAPPDDVVPAARPAPAWADEPISPVPDAQALDPQRVALGAALFADPRLSGKGDLSCASCHDLTTNGAMAGPRKFKTDTPTVFNVGLSFRFGWEGLDRTLEAQAGATVDAPLIKQGVPFSAVLDRLRADPALERRFRQVYRHGVDRDAVLDALAIFQRSLLTPNSRFDRWLRGDAHALTAQEQRGYALFKQAGCVACHQGQNIGGNLRQRHGIFRPLAAPEPAVLRVPSLRNVATTAPYFHDGSAPTLENAVTRMAASQLDVTLAPGEAADIAQFLRSLTGEYRGKPVRPAQ